MHKPVSQFLIFTTVLVVYVVLDILRDNGSRIIAGTPVIHVKNLWRKHHRWRCLPLQFGRRALCRVVRFAARGEVHAVSRLLFDQAGVCNLIRCKLARHAKLVILHVAGESWPSG